MACAEVVSEPLLVAAIDFGTTFSGYAFQTRANFKDDPLRIHGFTWTSGSNAGLSQKTPTCVLFDPSQNFHSFGLEAEDKYAELAQGDDHRNWYYFRRFKMNFYKSADIPRDLPLEDDQGKHLPAIKVISESLNYLREHVMKTLWKLSKAVIRPSEINWVLTVPAIWGDAAKQFLREAAVKGGIPNSQLMLVLEPEAASIYCQHIPCERMVVCGKSALDAFSPGTKYLILDAGGSTMAITVQEVQYDGSIKQLYMANGGDWGGTKIDQAFEEFLQELVGAQTIYRFREEDKSGYLDLIREFEFKKQSIKPDHTSKVTIKVPYSIKETFEKENGCDLGEFLSQSSKRVTLVGNKLRIEPESARELFKSTCDYITDHLEQIFSDPKVKGTNTILMVGGFSDSPILRDAVETAFPYKTIIIPQDAELAVLMGAVMFGFEPKINIKQICERIPDVKTDSTFHKCPSPVYKKIPDQCRTLLEQDQCQKDNEVPVSEMNLVQSELLKSTKEKKEELLQEHKQEVTTVELEYDMLDKENEDIMIDFKENSKGDEEKISKLQDDYEVLLSTYSSEKRMHQHNDHELMQLRNDIRICQKEKTQLEKALKDQTWNNLELQDKLRDLELERSTCWQCDEYERTVVKLKKEKQELQDKYKVKVELLQKVAKENQQLIDDIDQLKSNIIGHVQEIKSLNTSIEVMKEENSRKDCYTTTSLPDPDRPANLGRRFCELFEEEWSEALSELNGNSRTNIDYLRNIVTESYLFAKTSAEKYLDNLDNAILQINRSVQVMKPNIIKINKDHRRIITNYLAKDLHESFVSGSQKYIGCGPHLTSFMKKLVPLCFKMVLHDPPLVLFTQEEGIIDPVCFEPYQEFSGEMNCVIWPALYLHEGGIVLCKGIAGGTK